MARTTDAKKDELVRRLSIVIPDKHGGFGYNYTNYDAYSEKVELEYSEMTVAELKWAIDLRNGKKLKNCLTKTGTKLDLIKRLEQDDK